MDQTTIDVQLPETNESWEGFPKKVGMKIHVRKHGVAIEVEGYSAYDDSEPLYLCAMNGKVELLVWDNINTDSFKKVDIEGARVERKEPEEKATG